MCLKYIDMFRFELRVCDANGSIVHQEGFHPAIFGQQLPATFVIAGPPAPPPRLVSITADFRINLHGMTAPISLPPKSVAPPPDYFLTDSPMPLPTGWEAFEVFPLLPEEHWNPAFASLWAEIDLQNAVSQSFVREAELTKIDGRTTERERRARVLDEFEALLAGPEEPVHQFIKAHPEILSPVHEHMWSKFRFGNRTSDFVFREAYNDYLLIEIEAPHKPLFRKNGHPRQELQTPINQIREWLTFISDNRVRLEKDHGLVGISVSPRLLVVIGRSKDVTEANRSAIRTLEATIPRLRIRTYDDVLSDARVNLERTLGPLALRGEGAKIYWHRQ